MLLFNYIALGQDLVDSKRELSAVNAYVSLGYMHKDFSTLNSYSIDNDLPVFSDRGLDVGFGGNVFFKRFLFGGQGNIGLSANGYSTNSQINSGSAFLNMGYVVFENRQSLFYPTLGVGIRGTILEITPNNSMEGEAIDISSTNLLANLSVNADFFQNPGNYNRGGLVLGLSLGYHFIPSGFRWNTSNSKSGDELREKLGSINTSGIQFKIKLGWGVKK